MSRYKHQGYVFRALPLVCVSALASLVACGPELPELEERPEETGEELRVEEPIAFTSDPYPSSLQGPDSIASLRQLVSGEAGSSFVWQGFASSSPYPVMGDCEPGSRETVVDQLDELPVTIEGVVTLHPRYFVKPAICGEDERYYGSFFIEDATGGILVLRDSRISPFSYGDRVKLRVKGVTKFFDYMAVLSFDELEITTGDELTPISYVEIDREFEGDDKGEVVRIRGEVVSEATNNNFNELKLKSLDDDEVEWLVSLDRELGQRNPEFYPGTKLALTGPVIESFGMRMVVASYGQVEFLED